LREEYSKSVDQLIAWTTSLRTVSSEVFSRRELLEYVIRRRSRLCRKNADISSLKDSLPTKIVFLDNVRNVQDILVDPWFADENGRPSITALLRRIMLGDYVLVPGHEDIWRENFPLINQNAAQYDGQAIAAHPPGEGMDHGNDKSGLT
jgi:hypothetical protein